ncbi:unnamed protein product [Rotaria socialis]|uniref:Small-subunit processome Utp12 domain-containing protein n=1 Tax=Rotaria socialis TaxID=392032 RepID=A0A818QL25_9BILA|nr:unnamed protein product [Rotaria socialis]CAF3715209.1 unnamed protein product [Rotaria socialis]CAF4232334.1 unnamed protein product [Rotaria socialis]CAF4772098.1 unnamed protein product [Rotaria socialis]
MVLTKQYDRHVPEKVFGIIGSGNANNIALLPSTTKSNARRVFVPACESVLLWDLKTHSQINKFADEASSTSVSKKKTREEVIVVSVSPNGKHLAVGYQNGIIKIFSLTQNETTVNFHGHKSTITTLIFTQDSATLISGSKDTDIIAWDLITDAGLYRLRGHKAPITKIILMESQPVIISSSKDMTIKFWDMTIQHCFHTIVTHRTEVWSIALAHDRYLVTGCSDNELRFFALRSTKTDEDDTFVFPPMQDEKTNEDQVLIHVQSLGSLVRKSKQRVSNLIIDNESRVLACHGMESFGEFFRIATIDEVRTRLRKRFLKARKRRENGDEKNEEEIKIDWDISLIFTLMCEIKFDGKIRAMDLFMDTNMICKIIALTLSNKIDISSLNIQDKTVEQLPSIEKSAHRTEIRCLAFSSDDMLIASGSGESLKIWNRHSCESIRTISCSYALCCMFLPGDHSVLIGCKNGSLQIACLDSASIIETIQGHEENQSVWAMCMTPDRQSFLTGGSDKKIQFWNFELKDDNENNTKKARKRLSFDQKRSFDVGEDVLALKISPNNRYFVAALMDTTVKVFFMDSCQMFLSLYGHSQPVLCLDISSDSRLVITGSSDRNIKIWGLDFGDCHRSLFAHDDTITAIQFVPKTHLFFSASKDNRLKYWDADKFLHIQTLDGHCGEIRCMSITNNGMHIVTAAHDRSIRLWERTEEPLILDEEKEQEREAQFENEMENDEFVLPGETNKEIGLAALKTIESLKGAESIIEALDIWREEKLKLAEHEATQKALGKEMPLPPRHIMLQALGCHYTAERFVLEALRKISASDLEAALLLLPFDYVQKFLSLIIYYLDRFQSPELCVKCAVFLIKIHHGLLTSSHQYLNIVEQLRTRCMDTVEKLRTNVGFNLAGLRLIRRQIEEQNDVILFADATQKLTSGETKKRKKGKSSAAILTIKGTSALA